MAPTGLHWLTMVGTVLFVFAASAILAVGTLTFAAAWIGRGEAPRRPRQPPRRPIHDDLI